jgi:hypothetical protein
MCLLLGQHLEYGSANLRAHFLIDIQVTIEMDVAAFDRSDERITDTWS